MPWRTRHLARHHPQALLFLPILLPPHAHIRKDASGKSKVTCSGRFLPHAVNLFPTENAFLDTVLNVYNRIDDIICRLDQERYWMTSTLGAGSFGYEVED